MEKASPTKGYSITKTQAASNTHIVERFRKLASRMDLLSLSYTALNAPNMFVRMVSFRNLSSTCL